MKMGPISKMIRALTPFRKGEYDPRRHTVVNAPHTMLVRFKKPLFGMFKLLKPIFEYELDIEKDDVRPPQVKAKKARTAISIELLEDAIETLKMTGADFVIIDVFNTDEFYPIVLSTVDDAKNEKLEIWIAPRVVP